VIFTNFEISGGTLMSIDLEQLKRLANDPDLSTRKAFEQLGFNNYATFDYQLKKNPEALRIWQEGRAVAAGEKSPSVTSKPKPTTAPKPKRPTPQKSPATTPPAMVMPRMGTLKIYLRRCFLSLATSIFMAR
jgi:hypothetical protein